MSILRYKKYALADGGVLRTGGGGSGGGGPTQSTSYSTNIPEYARPYVENMLQAAQTQVYNDDMTSFRGYTPYSTDVNNYFAGFSPLQQQAQQSAWGMQTPGQYGLATGLAGQAGIGALGVQDQASYLGNEALGYGQAGQTYGDVGQMYGAQGAQQAQLAAQNAQLQAQRYGQQAVRAGQQSLGYGQQGAQYGQGAVGLGQDVTQMAAEQGLGYGAAGSGFGNAAASLAPQAQQYGQGAADIGMGGLGYGAQGSQYGQQAAQQAQQGYGAGAQFAQQATDPNAVRAYMSPYMQNVVDYQKSQAARDFGMAQTARQAKAVGAGAFGGSRQAIENAEAQRTLMSQLQGIEATGAQDAFKNAQAQQQFGANLGLQGLQAGYQGTGMGIQGAQAGLSGLSTAMQGQQAGLAGLGQAGSLYGQGMQGAQTGLQGLQGALAGSAQGLQGYQAGMQGAQTGLQGVSGALAGYNTGLSGVGQQLGAGQLGLQGTAQGIQGAQAGMQGAQTGLQGVQGAVGAGNYGLSGYGMANQAAGTLGQLGTQDLAAQQSIINLQNTLGGQQQALEQQKINQAIQDYAIQQQYPMMQLGFLSNMIRGLPMQSQTTQLYQAQPTSLQQGIGLLGAGASLYGAGKAEGGIVGYKYGGAIPSQKLEGMAEKLDPEQLQARLKDPQLDKGERRIFEDALEDKAKEKARYAGLGAAGGGLFNTMGYAGGGILAFAEEGAVKDPEELANQINLIGSQLDAINKEAGGRTAPGSKQRAFAPEKVAEFENLKKRQSELQSEYSDLMGKAGLDKPAVGYRSGLAPTTLYPNNTEQALLGTKPPEAKAMPTAGEFQAFDEATQRYLAEQKGGKGSAGPTGGAEGSKAYGAPSGGVGTGAGSTLGGILAGLRKEGPQGALGADYIKTLEENLAGADKRMSRADKIAMAKGFLKFGSTPAPGGIGQAAVAGLGEYTEGYAKAIESDEKYRAELNKQKQDVLALQRAEERGDVKLASEIQDRMADRANRLQTANISAAASGRAGAREDAYVKQLMAQGMTLEQALQAVKGAGKAESNDIARMKAADAALAANISYMRLSNSKDSADQQKAAQIRQEVYSQYGISPGGIGGSQTASAGVPKDIQGILNKYQ